MDVMRLAAKGDLDDTTGSRNDTTAIVDLLMGAIQRLNLDPQDFDRALGELLSGRADPESSSDTEEDGMDGGSRAGQDLYSKLMDWRAYVPEGEAKEKPEEKPEDKPKEKPEEAKEEPKEKHKEEPKEGPEEDA